MSSYLLLALIYAIVIIIVALYSNHKAKLEDKKGIQYELLSAFIALLLFPLILNAIGNDLLSKFLDGNYTAYQVLELIAYACATALASRSVINSGIETLKLNNLQSNITKQKQEITELEQEQSTILKIQAKQDVATSLFDDNYTELLNTISKTGSLTITDDNHKLINQAEGSYHINIYGKKEVGTNIKCKLTRLGKAYLSFKTDNLT